MQEIDLDDSIIIARFFKWDELRMQSALQLDSNDDQQRLLIKLGLVFDSSLSDDHPEIDVSLPDSDCDEDELIECILCNEDKN